MASRIPETVVEDVLSRASIEDLVGDYVRLKRRGSRLVGLCPFHNEKTPSFTVSPDRNLYHCFGCGASGNTVSFLMQHDGLSFPEAMRKLADRVGITIPESGAQDDPRAAERRRERDRYFTITGLARDLYEEILWSDRGRPGQEYLAERGIDQETARTFSLGFAPEAWSTLIDAAGRAGYRSDAVERAGLASPRRSGSGHYDRFRNRVMFPIVNLSGRVLAFSGRTLDPEERAKYINSPETALYTKGRELFGLHAAQRAIRDEGYAVLVEGNFDVVSLHARGIQTATAALGTALTERQCALLRRFTDRVVLVFDADKAGRAAARKALETLLAAGVADVRVVDLPDGSDPDDFVQEHGADALREAIEGAGSMLQQTVDAIVAPATGKVEPVAKRRAIDELAELLAHIRDRFVRQSYVSRVAQRLDIDEHRLAHYLKQPDRRKRRFADDPPAEIVERVEPIRFSEFEATLIESLILDDDLLDRFYREQIHHVIAEPAFGAFLERVARARAEDGGPGFREAVVALPDGPLRQGLTGILAREPTLAAEQARTAFDDTLRRLKERWIRQQKRRLDAEIRAAEAEGRFEVSLYERVRELDGWLAELTRTPKTAVIT